MYWVVTFITLFCLSIVLAFYTFLKSRAGENALKYPPRTKCEAFDSQFGALNATTGKIDITTTKRTSYRAYAIADKAPTVEHKAGAGYYQCYCTKFGSLTKVLNSTGTCYNFAYDKFWGYFLTLVNILCVQVVNYVIKLVVPSLVGLIGYDTITKRDSIIMQFTFASAVCNSALLGLLTNAEFRYYWPLKYLAIPGQYADMNEEWYLFIGP